MTEPVDPFSLVDHKVEPYLRHVGAIAVDAARIEWGLCQLVSMLTDQPLKKALRMYSDQRVPAIKKALQAAEVKGTDREPSADAIATWATTAQNLLKMRGDLMHSRWIIGDIPTPEDLVRTGLLTEEQAQEVDPTDFVNVYSYRLRADDEDLPIKRTVRDVAEFAGSLREHWDDYVPMFVAAGVVLGLWPAP